MNCPSELIRARFTDGALPPASAEAFEAHLADCADCRVAVNRLSAERNALSAALKSAEADGVIPAFVPRPTVGHFVSWMGWFALATWAVNMAWTSAAAALVVPGWLNWLIPDLELLGLETLFGLTLSLIGPVSADAAGMGIEVLATLTAVAFGVWILKGRGLGANRPLCLGMAIVLTMLVTAPTVHAFELRRDEHQVTIAASETIDDTLIVSAERILIEGNVTGDLVAAGERITVRGVVGGSLIAAGEEITVAGTIAGTVLTAGETLDYRGANLGGNLFAAGSELTLSDDTRIGGNAALAAGETTLEAEVGRDLLLGSGDATVSGSVLGSVHAIAGTLALTDTASVGGNLNVKVHDADSLVVSDGAKVAGETTVDIVPEEENRYLTVGFYVGVVLRIVAAVVAGLVLFHLFPSLATLRIDDGMQGLTAAGIGAVALVATPVLALVATATLIGAPIGLTAFLFYLVSLYIAGILTANEIGSRLIDREAGAYLWPLAAGLAIVIVLANLPVVGGAFRLLAVVVGLGLWVLWLRERWRARAV